MKKFLLILLIIIASCWLALEHFTLESSRNENGTYNIVVINKKSGERYHLMGK